MKVPFIDLRAQLGSIRGEVLRSFDQVMEQSAFAGGPFVETFERDFASFCGCAYATGVDSGTFALWCALRATGVSAGDEVITAANTFIATAEAITFAGATPVLVDVLDDTFNLDHRQLEKALSRRTKAIVPVHLYGQTADMEPILAFAREYGLAVIEDASQAHGATYRGRRAGTLGDAGCFSFYPSKNLGAFGEGGAVVTGDENLDQQAKMLRDHGQRGKYIHRIVGWNGRMDGLQGAVLSIKLKHLEEGNERRRRNAALYRELLVDLEQLQLPAEASYGRHVYHVFAVRTSRRDALLERLRENDVGCAVHYPIPIHLQEAYQDLGYAEGSFPVAEACSRELLSLPMYPELAPEQIGRVAEVIQRFMRAN
jgi:dTDP-4-amino-4,6-dideoxygalactose transaminase